MLNFGKRAMSGFTAAFTSLALWACSNSPSNSGSTSAAGSSAVGGSGSGGGLSAAGSGNLGGGATGIAGSATGTGGAGASAGSATSNGGNAGSAASNAGNAGANTTAGGAGGTGTGGAGASSAGGAGAAGNAAQAGSGGMSTGNSAKGTPNLFTSLIGKTAAEVDAKLSTAVNRFFGIGTGEPNTPTVATGYRCYYELPQDPSLAFVWAADSNDIRSEGMSYGMMIALQMNLPTQFDKLWKFVKTHAQYPSTTPTTAWKYYVRWQGTVDTTNASSWLVNYGATTVPAPDGEQYFAAALYLADKRWGSTGGVNYKQDADNLTLAMLHNAATSDSRFPLLNATSNMVVFVPYGASNGITDPSYHLPAFYELFSLYGPAADSAAWKSVAETSRAFLVSSAHPSTGLHPDYASFTGVPATSSAGDGHDQFKYDAWRVVLNMAVDYAWFSQDSRMKAQIGKYHTFFGGFLGTNNVTQSLFHVDGTLPTGGGSTALTGTLAAGSGASDAPNRTTYVTNLWGVAQQSGTYRYYQEGVYLLSLLSVAGRFNYAW